MRNRPKFTKLTPPDLTVIIRRYPFGKDDTLDPMWTVNTLIWTNDWSKDNGYFAADAESGYYSDGGPGLWPQETTDAIVETTLADGWQVMKIDWTDTDEDLIRLLQQCSPIEFHAGLADRDPEITGRVEVLFKYNSQEGAQ
jgi:hypothetical protein